MKLWRDGEGNCYKAFLSGLEVRTTPSAERIETDCLLCKCGQDELVLPEGAVAGNAIAISAELGERLLTKWLPLQNTAIEVPELVEAKCAEQVKSGSNAVYSDRSSAKNGSSGSWTTLISPSRAPTKFQERYTQEQYPFPLAVGYADPVIINWEGKYYFVATNDNVNNIGIFVMGGLNSRRVFR